MGTSKTQVAVLFGGPAGEHEISCDSAAGVLAHLNPDRYDVIDVKVDVDGTWMVGPQGDTDTGRGLGAALDTLRGVDVVFPALHGKFGEDGTVQSVLEMIGVPYVGSGVLASAVGMDKEYAKKLLAAEGIPVVGAAVLRAGVDSLSAEEKAHLGLPVFVKPARGGSSLGVTRVDSWEGLAHAISAARLYDPKVLVEPAVAGREIDLGVLEMPDGELRVSPPMEITVSAGHTFFDYDAKYHDSSTAFEIPARLDPDARDLLDDLARRAFLALDCAGLLRVDCFLRDNGSAVVTEVNTLPGLGSVSQYPAMWRGAGLSYPDLLDTLIDTSLRRSACDRMIR
ncbi:MAG: D-alanine--D-alanine ligase [Kutzneria sp.]|nr:D-alanine--D-alanine ligase [Kutzneria sp.]MBV9847347.1 D-alanine--D-alanine ligase [Kutzneria sp.]